MSDEIQKDLEREAEKLLVPIRELNFTISVTAHQGEIYEPTEGVECEDWPVIDVVPFYRAAMTTGEGDRLRRKILEGPNSHDLEAFNKMLDAILIEIRIESLKQFSRLTKPHDRVDAWKEANKNDIR